MAKKKIGIIGGGVIGTSIGYFLKDYDEAEVTIFEKNTIGSGTTAKSAGTPPPPPPNNASKADNCSRLRYINHLGR